MRASTRRLRKNLLVLALSRTVKCCVENPQEKNKNAVHLYALSVPQLPRAFDRASKTKRYGQRRAHVLPVHNDRHHVPAPLGLSPSANVLCFLIDDAAHIGRAIRSGEYLIFRSILLEKCSNGELECRPKIRRDEGTRSARGLDLCRANLEMQSQTDHLCVPEWSQANASSSRVVATERVRHVELH